MKKIFSALLALTFMGSVCFAQTAVPVKKVTKSKTEISTHTAQSTATSTTHMKKDGTHLKKDGTPDMRYKENKVK